jgi:hypothetical protein
VWDRGEERDFIEDVEYHEKEIWNWVDALEMQRELELDEIHSGKVTKGGSSMWTSS